MAENLLPCPFCGGVPHIFGDHHDVEGDRYWVVCCNRGCKVDHKLPRAEAIAAWNRRPAPMEAVAWREALEEALAGLEKIARVAAVAGIETVHDAKEWAHCVAIVAMCGPKVTAARQALALISTHPVQGGEG